MARTLAPGQSFAGYLIERLLGVGGMGEVYLARDRDLPRQVALKLLNPAVADNPEVRARFLREADTAARLAHPNIVAVYARGREQDRLWMAMQYIEGTDVAAALAEGPLRPDHAVRILGETAAALDHAHRAGVLHRDVKPANILLAWGPEQRVFLADFGIAKALDQTSQLTRTGEMYASFQYAAPEQFELRADMDHRADVYALGCTLFHMLTGGLPYPGASTAQLVNGHLNGEIPRPSHRNPGLSMAFDEVIARAMAKDRDRRYGSCGELARAAARALAEPVRVYDGPDRATGGAHPGFGTTRTGSGAPGPTQPGMGGSGPFRPGPGGAGGRPGATGPRPMPTGPTRTGFEPTRYADRPRTGTPSTGTPPTGVPHGSAGHGSGAHGTAPRGSTPHGSAPSSSAHGSAQYNSAQHGSGVPYLASGGDRRGPASVDQGGVPTVHGSPGSTAAQENSAPRGRRRRWLLVALIAVLVLAAGVGVGLGTGTLRLRIGGSDTAITSTTAAGDGGPAVTDPSRAAAIAAACDYGLLMNTYDYGDGDGWQRKVLAGATGTWKTQAGQLLPAIRLLLEADSEHTRGTDAKCAITSGNSTHYELTAEMTLVNSTQGKPDTTEQQTITMSMDYVDGRWLCSKWVSPLFPA
ncbi:protein kinase [Nocardia sp. NPDC005978]|uniref:serine/threonine-protein kinase n=1 Tax=Nocardia sp. NPDC005978 TaxID=3156725 RepID=UPI0033ACC333